MSISVPGPVENDAPSIGGWLIVFGFRLAIGLLSAIAVMLSAIQKDPSSVESFIVMTIVALGVWVFALFLMRRRSFVKSYIVVNLGMLAFIFLGAMIDPSLVTAFLGAIVGEMIAITYLLASERVKRTFVR